MTPASSYTERVHLVMDHVRADLRLDELAKVAGFSPYHFHRIFAAVAGQTLAAFTRRARLERAVYLMKAAPSRSLGSVALDAGYPSQSDFSRAFRASYGMAPSGWDRRELLRPATLQDGDGEAAGPGRFGRAEPPIHVQVRQHPAARIAYVRMRNPFVGDTLAHGYGQLTDWLERRDVDWRRAQLFGLSWDNYDATPLDQVRFDLGFAVPDHVRPEGEIGLHELPQVRSADAHSCGPLLRVAQAWDHLYLEWLPASGYEPADLPALKRFRRRPDETRWDTWDVDCSIALQPLRR